MTTALSERRKRRALSWIVGALAAIGIAATTVAIDVRSSQPNRVVGPVLPGLSQSLAEADKISIISSDATYRIARTERGWAMTDRGDFPVRAQRLAQLTEGLSQLAFVRRMTSDPARHDQLGVGDPTQGGTGILVQIENARGAFLANIILGVERDGLYARRPGEDQVWAVRGDLPPLRDPAAWLDLQPLALQPSDIVRVEIMPQEGRAYILERGAGGAFAFGGALAGRRAVSDGALAATAERIALLQPIDVLLAPAVPQAAAARLRVTTRAGVMIDADLTPYEDKLWLKLVARAETPEAQALADPINARVSAWAYALSQADAAMLAPSLESLLPAAGEAGDVPRRQAPLQTQPQAQPQAQPEANPPPTEQ